MAPKEHANLLSIFFWIFAGIQALMALFVALALALTGVSTILMLFNAKSGANSGVLVLGIMMSVMGLLFAFGLVSIYLNILAGKRLRNDLRASKKLIMTASILSLLSFLCGGIWILPFGVALGIYGLWFATSPIGYAYFNKLDTNQPQNYTLPPNPPNWSR